MGTPRVWLVTGASSGFGRSLTELILNKGDIVVATLRKPEVLKDLATTYPEGKLLVLKLDVTQQADIDDAFKQIKQVFGRLDVVFNNAGYGLVGEAETTPIMDARALFEVNFWGAANISRAAVNFFRVENEPGRGGVLLQNSSIMGFAGSPGLSFYAASKQALDAFSEILAKELLPQWNIKICIIQPGAFDTNVISNATQHLVKNSAYIAEGSQIAALRGMLEAPGFRFSGDPDKFTKAIYSLIDGGNIPMYLPIGQDALAMAKGKVELLSKEISDAEPWSADLERDDIGLSLLAVPA